MESAQNVRESKTIKRVHKAVLPPYLITTREGVLETKVEKGFFEGNERSRQGDLIYKLSLMMENLNYSIIHT